MNPWQQWAHLMTDTGLPVTLCLIGLAAIGIYLIKEVTK